MNINTSKMIWAALAATLFLVWSMRKNETQEIVLPKRVLIGNEAQRMNEPMAMNHVAISEKLLQRKSYDSLVDLFGFPEIKDEKSEEPRKKVRMQPVIVPPLPFQFVGRWKDQTQLSVMLSMNDEIVPAKIGDIVFNQYQLMNITEHAQGLTLEFLNQTIHQTQVLQVGKAQDE